MRKIYTLFFVVVFLGSYKSQETLPFYQQYLLNGEFLFNPALYGATDDVVLNLNYQKQFSNFAQSPNVQSVGMHANVFDRVGAGLSFFKDQNGAISSTGVSAGASYFIPIDDDGERKSQFSFGTNVNFYNLNIDLAQLNPQDPGDPVLGPDSNSLFLVYANLGMAVTIVTEKDKFIWFSQREEEQYFDLEKDPKELVNLIDDEKYKERIDYLRNILIEELDGREEGYTDGKVLLKGNPVGSLSHIK